MKRRTEGGARRAFFQVSPPPVRGGWRVWRRAGGMSVLSHPPDGLYVPLKLFSPSGVMRPFFRML